MLARGGEPVWVLDDELYRELTYVDDAGSLASVYPYTIAINGLSKSNALTGLRIGWTIAPAPLCDELMKVHAWIVTAANTFGQRVAHAASSPNPARSSEQAAWYRTQRAAVLAALRDSGLTFIEPDGAFYVCVKLPQRHRLARGRVPAGRRARRRDDSRFDLRSNARGLAALELGGPDRRLSRRPRAHRQRALV